MMRGNCEFVLSLSAIASALIETQAMIVANQERERHNEAPAYGPEVFFMVQQNMQDSVNRLASYIGDT